MNYFDTTSYDTLNLVETIKSDITCNKETGIKLMAVCKCHEVAARWCFVKSCFEKKSLRII